MLEIANHPAQSSWSRSDHAQQSPPPNSGLATLPSARLDAPADGFHVLLQLAQLLLYALHSDSDLDIEQIFHELSSNPELEQSTMSVAEKLIAKGRTEGFWSGKIQTLQEFLDLPVTQRQTLESMELAELEALHAKLHREYEVRFKR